MFPPLKLLGVKPFKFMFSIGQIFLLCVYKIHFSGAHFVVTFYATKSGENYYSIIDVSSLICNTQNYMNFKYSYKVCCATFWPHRVAIRRKEERSAEKLKAGVGSLILASLGKKIPQ